MKKRKLEPPTEYFVTSIAYPIPSTIDDYRLEYERLHGATDPSKQYTSQLDGHMQRWFQRNFPELYVQGLPPFLRSFVRANLRVAAGQGRLDDCSDEMIALSRYFNGSS